MGRQRRIQFNPVKNVELLSSHWLENRLPLEPEWREFAGRARETLDQLAQLGSTQRTGVEHYGTEAALEHAFIQPALEALGWKPLTLAYPSYILALAMGAGKTVLIGAIIATEFALALDYPDGPFVQNALVFAPGTTIIESLRELAEIPYDRILPPRLYKAFAASVKLTFTRDGEKDIPVVRGSSFNLVVTNTEKIRIQKEKIRKADIGGLFGVREDEAKAEVVPPAVVEPVRRASPALRRRRHPAGAR